MTDLTTVETSALTVGEQAELEQLEGIIRRGRETFIEVGNSLAEPYNGDRVVSEAVLELVTGWLAKAKAGEPGPVTPSGDEEEDEGEEPNDEEADEPDSEDEGV